MKKYFIVVIVIVAGTLTSCMNTSDNMLKKGVFQKSLFKWSDSSFVSGFIGEMTAFKNKLYISDALNGRVIVVDSNIQTNKIIGMSGEGPGEFLAPGNISFFKDSIYVYDYKKNIQNVYDIQGNYKRMYSCKDRAQSIGVRRQKDGAWIISTSFGSAAISMYDLNGEFKNSFGKINSKYASKNKKLLNIYNIRDLQTFESGEIVALFRSQPIIEIYDENGSLKLEEDIRKNRLISELYAEQDIDNMNNAMFLFRSMFVKDNILYILAQHKYESNMFINLVLKYEYNGKELKYLGGYSLEQEDGTPTSYSCFNILSDNKIIAYNWINKTLDIYILE